jgi:tRNA A-37 threonylcarbamoyl transferase component Bud32
MANLSGKTLGKVQVGELIARGGMAEVYLGEHTALNRKVAVKVMREHVESDPDNRARFEREARTVAGLRHPNIIQVFDYELMDGQPCLIMEYVPGASLGNYLKALDKRGERLPQQMVVRLLHALASAIDYAHSLNVIHRDLKPANVLLRSASGTINIDQPLPQDVEPILTDFGLVRLLDSTVQTSSGTVSGTPAYMSPEQARGDKLDHTTDIYSLGVMLYEMLAGNVPFDAESSFGVLMKHLNEPPPPIAGTSPELQAVINRALAKDPQMRYSSALELANEFSGLFKGETISPATFKTSQLIRDDLKKKAGSPARPFNWNFVFGGLIALAFVFVAYQYWATPGESATKVVGRVTYADFKGVVDKATFSTTDLPAPKTGNHYDIWYLSQGGETRRNIGILQMDENNRGQLVFISPGYRNILGAFDQVEITIEPDNDPAPDESSGEVAASSVFPPLALVHIRHLLVAFDSAPEQVALMQGLKRATKDLDTSVQELQHAYEKGNEKLFRQKLEQTINQISGSESPRYQDWNNDGKTDDPSDRYGLLFNGESGYKEKGYIAQVASHAKFAADSMDATESIKIHGAHVLICTENMEGWAKQMAEKAIQLQKMPFDADMKPIVDEITALSVQILHGVDSNGNEMIEPIIGEGGADTAFQHAYYMADMPLIVGTHQIPPPAATKSK